jgi:hypothetical protein
MVVMTPPVMMMPSPPMMTAPMNLIDDTRGLNRGRNPA